MVEIPLVMIFVDMAENALSEIADNPEYREELLTTAQSIDDWVQERRCSLYVLGLTYT